MMRSGRLLSMPQWLSMLSSRMCRPTTRCMASCKDPCLWNVPRALEARRGLAQPRAEAHEGDALASYHTAVMWTCANDAPRHPTLGSELTWHHAVLGNKWRWDRVRYGHKGRIRGVSMTMPMARRG
ncbi:hypothetical protein F5Y08DRAFT_34696 [Xylaria arbuscula]|nr:hypothetical protein F5Y08DRAFT_34696 [Xylaria arbuscula]